MRAAIALLPALLAAQSAFEVASVKPSARTVGPDYGNKIVFSPTGVTARNTTLKRLIVEAYHVHPFQVQGGPKWIDSAEFDVEAKSGAGADQRAMLSVLLAERFHLAFHRESREMRVYNLSIDKNRPTLKPGNRTMQELADYLAVQLSIHVMDDPTKPGMASGPPVPVIDQTGLTGSYNLDVSVKPEPGADMLTLWQRALRDNLGLKLESAKAPIDVLIIDSADKTPVAN